MSLARGALVLMLALLCAGAGAPQYELRGRLHPATRASVWLHGASAPFEDSTLAGEDGRFRFRDLTAGTYTLGIFVPGSGEMRRTIEIGPSQSADGKRIELTVELRDSDFESHDSVRRQAMVSTRQLAISERAHREYDEAEKRLARRDVEGAVAHFTRAVELAPQYSEAWNHLGTIAYQARDYTRAEGCFRKALDADHEAFHALVNLGGVLINLNQFEESLRYNLYAALTHPNDALANSQLGMSYFFLGKLDQAEKYLTAAKRLDPAHFSHPQLILAEIALRRKDAAAAAGELEAFLQYHPDAPQSDKVKKTLAELRARNDPQQAFRQTGMAHSFSESPDLPPIPANLPQAKADAVLGSGRHMRLLLERHADGTFSALQMAWYSANGGKYDAAPAFTFNAACLTCHADQTGGRPTALACASCHGAAGSEKPSEATCLGCHPGGAGAASHIAVQADRSSNDDRIELNSAGYRLRQSRCYQASAGKLTCTTCHPPHGFAKTAQEYRMVCRSCHPETHNAAALDCAHCHMPQRAAQDIPKIAVTDHRIQRPL